MCVYTYTYMCTYTYIQITKKKKSQQRRTEEQKWKQEQNPGLYLHTLLCKPLRRKLGSGSISWEWAWGSLGAKDSCSVGGKALVYYLNCGDGFRGWYYTYQNW